MNVKDNANIISSKNRKKEKQETLKLSKTEILRKAKKLSKHTERNINTNHINYKLFYLLLDPFTFVNAYTKISKNKGALTKGHEDEGTMKYFGIDAAKRIVDRIKKGKYKFKPVKRTWIPKPGKNKKRPIDVPSQSDRIVQEAIRGILEAIFEPVFQEYSCHINNLLSNNYGFRPNMSTWTAVETLKNKIQRCNIIIEGDIISAYNKVDHEILMKLLEARIRDKKFLRLIRKMLKSGIFDGPRFEHSLSGTPQGGIVSPLLFNIYMLGLDQYVYDEIIKPILKENEKKTPKKTLKAYEKYRRLTIKALKELQELKKDDPKNRTAIKSAKEKFKKARAIRNSFPSTDITNQIKGAVYVRYADDWVLALTCNQKKAEKIKSDISSYLEVHRKMQLDDEKTKITRLSKGYKFLGFETRMNITKPKLKRVLIKDVNGKYSRPLRRTTSRLITVEPDSERILQRLKNNKFCDKLGYPKGKAAWTVYDEFEIVQKFAQIFRSIFVYYLPCGKLSRLSNASYILQYSCAKTLAKRKKVSLRNIFNTYTKKLTIERTIKGTKGEKTRKISFDELSDLRKKQKFIRTIPVPSDPFRIQEHWRTKFKFYNECCICGETKGIALHHLNSLGSIKTKKRDDFEYIRSQTNRIQIPVCNSCHNDITSGKYNDEKTPTEFYNEFLAKL